MSSYKIGKVIGVIGDAIDIVLEDSIQEDSGVPANMLINISSENGPVHWTTRNIS